MDPEDEPNSYLKFLNDAETPNTYLLENNEVGLFSVEPMFTEIGTADWPQEGFPLLLTQGLITEGVLEEQPEPEVVVQTPLEVTELPEEPGEQENTATLSLPETDVPMEEIPEENVIDQLFCSVTAHKCKVCSHLCEDLTEIKAHITSKHSEYLTDNPQESVLLSRCSRDNVEEPNRAVVIYICSECNVVFTNKNDLKNHMIHTHKLETVTPSPKKTKEAHIEDSNIGLVKKQEKLLQQVKCTIKGCTAGFPSDETRAKHEKLHVTNTKSMFKCSECDKTSKMWDIARSHMHTEHGIDFGMIVCPMCSLFKSYKAVRMIRHMMVHSDEKPFLCQDCGLAFKQLAQLKNHEVVHKMPDDMPLWARVKKCTKCDRFFANSKSLKAHIKTVHERIKPFICNICGHKSSRKAMLELHMRQHTASKPHKCDHCPFRTGDPNSLRKHTMRHLGAVAYQCPYCTYSCIQSSSIKSHLQHRHKDKGGVYRCKFCAYTSINGAYLEAHQKLHQASNEGGGGVQEGGASEQDLHPMTDDETQSCFLTTEAQIEETVDEGGITIPAGLEMPLVT